MGVLNRQQHIVLKALEGIKDGFLVLDHRFTLVYMNREVERLTGRSREDVLGLEFWSAFPEVRGTPFEEACRQAMRTQETAEAEISVPQDGRRYHARCYPDGNNLYVYCRDITDWRLYHLTQAAERRWLGLIIQGRPEMELAHAITEELEAAVQFGAACALSVREDQLRPLTAGERLARMFREHDGLLRLDSVRGPAAAAVFEARPVAMPDVTLETRWPLFRKAARASGFLGSCACPVIGRQGAVLGVVAMYTDYRLSDPAPYLELTAAAARTWGAALERQRAALPLGLLGAVAGELAATHPSGGPAEHLHQREQIFMMGSHELRNGLAAVQGALDLLTRRSQETEALPSSDVIRIARRAQRSMGYLMNLFESTLHSAARPLDHTPPAAPVNLAETVAETVCRYQTVSETHTIRLDRHVDSVRGPWDALRLRHVLGNLLSNAVKYSPDNSIIEVSLSVEDGCAILSVRDQGVGIPDDDLSQIFLPYQRGRNVGNKPGTGIGLALVREVVEGYRGTVEVAPNQPYGTVFTVRLPLE